MQWYFKKINSENTYAKNIENEEIMNLSLKDSWGIYSLWINFFLLIWEIEMSFYPDSIDKK